MLFYNNIYPQAIYLNLFIYMFPWVLRRFISACVVCRVCGVCTYVTKCSLINLRFSQTINYIINHPEKIWGVGATRTYHIISSYTRHIAIFAVFDCFLHVWRPVAQPHNYFLRKLFYQSKGKTFPVILHPVSICYLNAFKSNVKKTFV